VKIKKISIFSLEKLKSPEIAVPEKNWQDYYPDFTGDCILFPDKCNHQPALSSIIFRAGSETRSSV
jgi:hypothetical protein